MLQFSNTFWNKVLFLRRFDTLADYYGSDEFLYELAILRKFYDLIMKDASLDEFGKASALGG